MQNDKLVYYSIFAEAPWPPLFMSVRLRPAWMGALKERSSETYAAGLSRSPIQAGLSRLRSQEDLRRSVLDRLEHVEGHVHAGAGVGGAGHPHQLHLIESPCVQVTRHGDSIDNTPVRGLAGLGGAGRGWATKARAQLALAHTEREGGKEGERESTSGAYVQRACVAAERQVDAHVVAGRLCHQDHLVHGWFTPPIT
eukprot:COSAG01_NODE_778_length_13681_cov_15.265130_1_plen_196_part_10